MKRTLALSLVAVGIAAAVTVAVAQPKPAAPQKAAPPKLAPQKAGAPSAGDAALRAALEKAVPGIEVDSIKPSLIPGYREVAISGRVVYVSNDGKYLIQGTLMELQSRDNLTAVSEGALRRGMLDAVPRERRIIFSPAKPKYRLTVFTDIDCGFCRKMHNQMAEYNKAGISVEYLFFPRAGEKSEAWDKAVSVWCAPNRQKALTDAKADRPVPKKSCTNPIAEDYALGKRVGVDGTPAVYGPDGTQLGGYLSPADMLAKLNRSALRAVATK
jgi:thiol:disulfide interchange protein DsbC